MSHHPVPGQILKSVSLQWPRAYQAPSVKPQWVSRWFPDAGRAQGKVPPTPARGSLLFSWLTATKILHWQEAKSWSDGWSSPAKDCLCPFLFAIRWKVWRVIWCLTFLWGQQGHMKAWLVWNILCAGILSTAMLDCVQHWARERCLLSECWVQSYQVSHLIYSDPTLISNSIHGKNIFFPNPYFSRLAQNFLPGLLCDCVTDCSTLIYKWPGLSN